METTETNALELYFDKNIVAEETKKSLLDNFQDLFKQTQEWKEKAEALVVTSPDQKEDIKNAGIARKALKNIRVEVEKKRKELKEESLRKGQTIDAIAKILTNEIIPSEEHLEKQEKFVELLEAKLKAELKAERLELLQPYGFVDGGFSLDLMDEDTFQNLLAGTKKAFEDRIEAEKKAEADRIQKENDERIDRERIKAENEKLKTEAEAKEKIRSQRNAELRPYIIFIRDYNGMLEMSEEQYQKELSDIKVGAQQHYEYEAKENARKQQEQVDLEAKFIAEQKEKLRIERELQDKKDAELKAEQAKQAEIEADLSKGDKQKFDDLIKDMESLLTKYTFKSKKYKTIQSNVNELINKTINYAISK